MCQKSLVANLRQVEDVAIEATLNEFAYGLLIDKFIGESLLLSLSVELNASFVSASLDVLRWNDDLWLDKIIALDAHFL